jgi:hypothetical protein
MTSNLTVCWMADRANQPHLQRAAERAWLAEQAANNARASRTGVAFMLKKGLAALVHRPRQAFDALTESTVSSAPQLDRNV